LAFTDFVQDHVYGDPKAGQERGFVCDEHHDAIMGLYEPDPGKPRIT
jgi:hypothetical protein